MEKLAQKLKALLTNNQNFSTSLAAIADLSNPVIPTENDTRNIYQNFLSEKPTIVIDCGHGYYKQNGEIVYDIGAKVVRNKKIIDTELNRTQEYSNLLVESLKNAGFNVVLSIGTEEKPLESRFEHRIKHAVEHNAFAYISIHMNANPHSSSLSGTEVYCPRTCPNQLSEDFANVIGAKTNAREVFFNKNFLTTTFSHTNTYSAPNVCHKQTTAAILLEVGYLTNKNDYNNIKSEVWRSDFINHVTEGVTNFFDRGKELGIKKQAEILIESYKQARPLPLPTNTMPIDVTGANLEHLNKKYHNKINMLKL